MMVSRANFLAFYCKACAWRSAAAVAYCNRRFVHDPMPSQEGRRDEDQQHERGQKGKSWATLTSNY